MQTRRDRLQAYQYQVKRIMSALLGMEPEAPDQPMRRVRAAMFSGIMVGALACGGVALYGWITHSQTRGWKNAEQALIQIKETGAQYILLANNDVKGKRILYPVTNYTSAQLILGDGITKDRRTIPRINTDGVPRGQVVGINGIPPSLPDRSAMARGNWQICNHVETVNGKPTRAVDLFSGQSPVSQPFLGQNTIAVRDTETNKLYVIYNGKRLPVASADTLTILGLEDRPIVRVMPAWLNTFPEGAPLEPIAVPDAGTQTNIQIKGEPTAVGQVFQAKEDFYVMRADGLERISETQALLLTGLGVARDPSGEQESVTSVEQASVRGNVANNEDQSPPDHPKAEPKWQDLTSSDPMLCLTYNSESPEEPIGVMVGGSMGSTTRVKPVGGVVSGPPADTVSLPGGKFSLIRSVVGTDNKRGSIFILTDDGLKYPLRSQDVLNLLGYGGLEPWPVPRGIADLIPTGPALDPAKAKGPALADLGAEAQPTESAPAGN